jgi:hypothetical protein
VLFDRDKMRRGEAEGVEVNIGGLTTGKVIYKIEKNIILKKA